MRQRVVADDGLDARRRELADKRGDDVVAHRHRGERAERVEQDGGEVRHHARDEHDGEAALAAVLVEVRKRRVLVDDLLGRIAEEEAQKHEAQEDADRLGRDGEEDAPEDAEDQRVGRREDDGGREAQRVDEERQEEAEKHGPLAEGGDVAGRLLDIAAREQAPEMRQEGRVGQVDDEEEQDDGERCSHLYHPHGFFHMVIPPRSFPILQSHYSIASMEIV